MQREHWRNSRKNAVIKTIVTMSGGLRGITCGGFSVRKRRRKTRRITTGVSFRGRKIRQMRGQEAGKPSVCRTDPSSRTKSASASGMDSIRFSPASAPSRKQAVLRASPCAEESERIVT